MRAEESRTVDPRSAMVESAARLLAEKGYQATSFSAVLEASGAPRGSIYHHFPGGKDELIAAAVAERGAAALAQLHNLTNAEPVDLVRSFVQAWRALLQHFDFAVGCSLVGATVGGAPDDVRSGAAAQFRSWRAGMAEAFRSRGLNAEDAGDLAATVLAACEGAVVLCRAERSLQPLDAVERQLIRLIEAPVAD